MFASIIIISFSTVLFLYWFRYSCLLILSTKTAKDYTADVARANGLEFPRVQSCLRDELDGAELARLRSSLDHDYRLLTGLFAHASEFEVAGVPLEHRMLMIDYQVMKLWSRISAPLSRGAYAQRAVEEMAEVVAHFANAMGERSAMAARA